MTLPHTYELLRPPLPRGPFRLALFDFDGTLSQLREGWPEVMRRLMLEVLQATPRHEPPELLQPFIEEIIARLNGQPTIFQMSHLAQQVSERGGKPESPEEYKAEYLRRLMALVEPRRQALASGAAQPEEWSVPGSRALLERLKEAGVRLVLASGTDLDDVRIEAKLLRLDEFFGDAIHGALPDGSFSKPHLLSALMAKGDVKPAELVGFGDGIVETAAVKRVGGVAVGVASDFEHPGRLNAWKRPQLAEAGADFLIPDFGESDWLADFVAGRIQA